MRELPLNKYRAAMEILLQGRDQLVETLADDVLDQQENLLEGGFQFHEFLESQGARLHFLGLIMGHLEQSAELIEELQGERLEPLPSTTKSPHPQPRKRSKARNPRGPKTRRQPPPDSEETPDETPF
jgi:hypothetical protein